MSGCRRCEIDLLHCHGTLVQHGDGGWECSTEGCTGDAVTHDLVLSCADAWSTCCADRSFGRVEPGRWRRAG